MQETHVHRYVAFSALLATLHVSQDLGFAAVVGEREALAVADLWLKTELTRAICETNPDEIDNRLPPLEVRDVLYLPEGGDLSTSRPKDLRILAYVVTYSSGGFAVVSAEDRLEPLTVFAIDSSFRWDRAERNFLRAFLTTNLGQRWDCLLRKTAEGAVVEVHPNWIYLRSRLREDSVPREPSCDVSERSIQVLWDTPAWDQGQFYNDEVIIHNGGTPGIPTGCTATAMAIKMRFHSWPTNGNGSHSYTDLWGGVQFAHAVNFGGQTYNWANMPTGNLVAPNLDVATLMYHCGVAVEMDYEVGASRAWPSAAAVNTFFRYKGTTELTNEHDTPIITSIRGGLPVVLSSNDHTVVACGYRDTMSPYFYLNCGWSGTNDGWYNLDQIPGGDPTIDRSYPYSSPEDFVYVDAGWTGSENGTIQMPFNTLSEANSVVVGGGDLWIKAGTYTGPGNVPITMDTAMTIRAYEGTASIGY